MNLRTTFLLLILVWALRGHAFTDMPIGSLLDTLDLLVDQQEQYDQQAALRIRKYKETMLKTAPARRLPVIERLGREYTRANIDSAFVYFDMGDSLARQLGDSAYVWHMALLRYQAYPLKSMLHNALNDYERIDPRALPADVRQLYFESGYQIYNLAADMYMTAPHQKMYRRHADRMIDSMLVYTEPNSVKYRYYNAKRNLDGDDGAEAVADLKELLEQVQPSHPVYARMSADIARYFLDYTDNTDQAMYYLAISAISDVRTGNAETTSLHRLGRLLYDNGDIDRAYRYLTNSLERSVASGASIRALEIAQALPVVLKTGRERQSRAQQVLIVAIAALATLFLVVLAFAWHFYRTRQSLARMRERLELSHQAKDAYTRQILSLCGAYISEIESYNRLAGRKLKAKQYADLLDMIESGKITHTQIQMFFDVFDSAFLHVYPNFIAQASRLFKPGEAPATPEHADTLNTELRLMALIRLGIQDSGEIAKFLGLSVNTVYSYRNKLKSRVLDRAGFERDIAAISHF